MNKFIDDTIKYLNREFPNYCGTCHVRYELGEPFPNGSNERLNQVYERSRILFEDLFTSDDLMTTIVRDWNTGDDIMFGNTTPDYIYELMSNDRVSVEVYDMDEDVDEAGNDVIVEIPFNLTFGSDYMYDMQYREILMAIANYEQGKEPSIGQKVYFLCKNKGILFHMYDDRGLIIHANDPELLRNLYLKYNDWIVNYWKATIDDFFV